MNSFLPEYDVCAYIVKPFNDISFEELNIAKHIKLGSFEFQNQTK